MQQYNPKAPNELADAQLNRVQFESEKSKALADPSKLQSESNEYLYGANPVKHHAQATGSAVLDQSENDPGEGSPNKESYNSIPGE